MGTSILVLVKLRILKSLDLFLQLNEKARGPKNKTGKSYKYQEGDNIWQVNFFSMAGWKN